MANTSQKTSQEPRSLLEAVRYFSEPDRALDFVRQVRWSNGEPVCPWCGSKEHSFVSTRRIWKCKNPECRKQFSAKAGTIFEDSPLGWEKWLPAVWLLANSKNSVSSHELARALGVTQKTAWFMLHRIRDAMDTGTFQRLTGTVEVDETFVGPRAERMNNKARRRNPQRPGGTGKTAVQGARSRDNRQVHASVLSPISKSSMETNVRFWADPTATVYTDENPNYVELGNYFTHKSINHTRDYVAGDVHINGIESFWSLLKRAIKGTQVHVSPDHLGRYVTERRFAYNHRDRTDLGRMRLALGNVGGRRLTWAELTDHG